MKENYPAYRKWIVIQGWLLDTAEKYPKSIKFTFGDRLINMSFDILDLLITAIYSKQKQKSLELINFTLEKLRAYMLICSERKYISLGQYEHICTEISEFGRMIGGWIKTCTE